MMKPTIFFLSALVNAGFFLEGGEVASDTICASTSFLIIKRPSQLMVDRAGEERNWELQPLSRAVMASGFDYTHDRLCFASKSLRQSRSRVSPFRIAGTLTDGMDVEDQEGRRRWFVFPETVAGVSALSQTGSIACFSCF